MFWKASLLSLALPAYAAVHEAIAAAPAGWRELDTSDAQGMTLQVALQYKNLDQLDAKLQSVATPGSADYGKWLSKTEVDALFSPSSDSVEKVKAWVASSGASDVKYDTGIVSFRTTVGDANKLLDAKFTHYTDEKVTKLRTLSYSIPDELSEHIDLVSPATFFGQTKSHAVAAPARPVAPRVAEPEVAQIEERQLEHACLKTVKLDNLTFPLIGPDCLKELYNVGDYVPDASSGASVAFGNFLNESASYSDLAKFEKIYNITSQSFKILAEINGGKNDQNPKTELDGEANLDVQNIMGLVHPLPVGAFITGGSPPFKPDLLSPNQSENENEPYLPYYQYILAQENSALPQVITNSYGDHENTVPFKYATRVCQMIGMVGLRGITVLESSGDEGTGAVCLTNDGKANKHAEFTPQFPGTCPYITGVGGTQFYNPEAAWNASSGGFSNYFPTPYYQADAVKTYTTKYISKATYNYYASNQYANFSGRGFPDISAHSLYPYYLTVINGTAYPNGGTSAASPTVAGIITLLNDALFRAGKPQLGFLNPFLYSSAAPASALNDITTGGSLGCNGVDLQTGQVIKGAGIIPYASWNATTGWDPVTGLGTPNFQALKALVLGTKSTYGS